MKGKATLTLGIAGAKEGALSIKLNGKDLEKKLDLENDSSLHRSGIKGRFREKFISFDLIKEKTSLPSTFSPQS